MMRTILASAALVAAVQAAGDAIVINKCSYDVHMSNVPASGGGYESIDQMLTAGGSYTQKYTQLSNGNGWSIKLSKSGEFGTDILQYEYTYHNDGIIWYDLSEVDGNPWDKNWEITATDGCSPRQAAYRYATDDAYGMQSCHDGASITVTLCSGESGGSSEPPASPSETWAPTSVVPSVPLPTSTYAGQAEAPAYGTHPWGFGEKKVKVEPAGDAVLDAAPSAAPAASSAPAEAEDNWDGPAVTVTNVHMETMTKYVTATAAPAAKRHVHHPRHPHRRS